MSETQGSFDLALSRYDHDMMFPKVYAPPTTADTIWDNRETTWDGGATIWDHVEDAGLARHAIWAIDGADKVAQQIKMNLLTFFGEWFLDDTWGVPHLEDILVKNPHLSSVETILRQHINSVFHVIYIESFTMNWDRANRVLQVIFTAHTDYGTITETIKLDKFSHV